MRPGVASRLGDDRRGNTAVEFAIVAPVMCLFLAGSFDMAHSLYTRAVLQGIVQKTARDSGLENSTDPTAQAALDAKVKNQVLALANNADVKITRRFYRTFSDAQLAKAEPWTDTDKDGTCDSGEPYQDDNGNNTWDKDGGDAGQGTAKDRTVYTVTMSYPRMFPIQGFLPGFGNKVVLVASTVLENQPYSDQQSYGSSVIRNCP